MKKFLSILVCVSLMISLTACGKTEEKNKDDEAAKNTKSIVCNMKEEITSQDEMSMKLGYKFNFVDEKATDFVMTYNIKVNKQTEENMKQLNETDWESQMKESFKYMGIDENAIKVSSKKIADNELEITITMNFKDFAKELFNEDELKELDNMKFDEIKDKIIKSVEENEDEITCEVSN